MESLESEIVFALALAKDSKFTALNVAGWMAEAIRTLPLKGFQITQVSHSGFTSVEYAFGPTKHSIHNAASSKITTDGIEGSLLNRGRLIKFAQATWFGETLIPHVWYEAEFRKDLANPAKHLATIEEVLWVGGFWDTSIDPRTIVNRYKMPGRRKNVDWRFLCRMDGFAKWINLEVKRRDGDIKALIPRGSKVFDPFADISDKFSASTDEEINVAGITVFGSDETEVVNDGKRWLEEPENENVDCLVIWNDVKSMFAYCARDSKLDKLRGLLVFLDAPTPADPVPILIQHPIEVPGVPSTI
jgi:hypothetical protein